MWKSRLDLAVVGLVLTFAPQAIASGGFSPIRWLDNGGILSDRSPEFFWELEVKRLAKEFTPAEKRIVPITPKSADPNELPPDLMQLREKQRVEADIKDFDDAIKTGRIKPDNIELARKVNRGEGAEGDKEFPSEFADYRRGAGAFTEPDSDPVKACAAWEALLKRPAAERHYRSVWAAFMLGKAALFQQKPEAVKWFQMTRDLAKQGFADSIGLAADSYGWEAKSELDQGHYETAAKLYLTQLALGDESAIVSLKAIIPDRSNVEGQMNFTDPPPPNGTDEELKKLQAEQVPKIQARIAEAARSPILRRLTTAHILATETVFYSSSDESDLAQLEQPNSRCIRWLDALEKAGSKELDDADHLGWVAYTAGRYAEAARWLKMAKGETATSLWLDAKLKSREGKLAEAEPLMAKALKLVRAEAPARDEPTEEEIRYPSSERLPVQSAAGDLAALRLSRKEFPEAMSAFLEGNLWEDAAFIGDRVLTVDELKQFVEASYPARVRKPGEDANLVHYDDASRLRWMLARRLVREDRYAEARTFFPANMLPILDAYVKALDTAANEKLPKEQRARAWFTAAFIARFDGMELMGTEMEPDGFVSGGGFDPGSVDQERTEGARVHLEYDEKKQSEVKVKKPVKIYIPASADEKKRIEKSKPLHNVRFHYRRIASVLTTKAAALMPDNTEELADVISSGSMWIRRDDEKGADEIIRLLFKRCGDTAIANNLKTKQPLKRPWTDEETAARKIRNGIKDTDQ